MRRPSVWIPLDEWDLVTVSLHTYPSPLDLPPGKPPRKLNSIFTSNGGVWFHSSTEGACANDHQILSQTSTILPV